MSKATFSAIGRLGQDPVYESKGESGFCRFSVATTRTWKDKQTGEKQEKTTWLHCFMNGKRAEIFARYHGKGDMVSVDGTIETYKPDGAEFDRYNFRVNDFHFLPNRNSNSGESGGGGGDPAPF